MTTTEANAKIERAKAAVRETAARLADEEAKHSSDRRRIQRLQSSLSFSRASLAQVARHVVQAMDGEE